MKLTLIRHGIAEDKKIWKSDFDRALTLHGCKKLLKHLGIHYDILQSIDAIVCSPSLRTRQTCAMLCTIIPFVSEKIIYDKRIYTFENNYYVLLNTIRIYSWDKNHLCLIGHNHSISSLASYLVWEEVIMKKGEIKVFDL